MWLIKLMKQNHWLVIVACLLLLVSCSRDEPLPVQQSKECPPEQPGGSFYGIIMPRVSFDRRYIAWVTRPGPEPWEHLWLLDRSINTLHEMDLASFIKQPTFIVAIPKLVWSPYASSKLLLDCVVNTDTIGNGTGMTGGHQVLILDVETDSVTNATPIQYGRGGGDFSIITWLPGSTPSADSILMAGGEGITVLPSRRLVTSNYLLGYNVGPGWEVLSSREVALNSYQHTLNGRDIQGIGLHRGGGAYSTWSPNGNYCVITAQRVVDDAWWTHVIDVKHNRLLTEVNFRKDCVYQSDADFLTDSTLVIQLHQAGTLEAPLVECTFSGKVIRELWKF
jgi:hypothetical protein